MQECPNETDIMWSNKMDLTLMIQIFELEF